MTVAEKNRKPIKFKERREGPIPYNPYKCDACEEYRSICGHDLDDDYRLYRKYKKRSYFRD